MKVFFPPLKEITWPHGQSWIYDYLRRGFLGITPRDWVSLTFHSGIDSPTEGDIDALVIYTMAKMGFTLGAIREFFTRREVIPKPDVDALYAKAIAQQHNLGRAPLLEDTPFFQILRIMRAYYDRPEGIAMLRGSKPVHVNLQKRSVYINVNALNVLASHEAALSMMRMPDPKDVFRDVKRMARRDYILDIATYSGGTMHATLSLDWMIRHELLPQNLFFSACIPKRRR
jgi:hypothetical protein